MWQVAWASADVALHTTPTAKPGKVWETLCTELFQVPATEGTMCPATWWHFPEGYDGRFYSYHWSEVYSADMFASRFEKEGIFNPATGASYRKEILAPGGSRDGMDSLVAFLGRKPKAHAFAKAIGLDSMPIKDKKAPAGYCGGEDKENATKQVA